MTTLRDIRRQTELGRMHDSLTVNRYEARRSPVTRERWVTHYGWSERDAAHHGNSGSEVRVYAVYPSGERRELLPDNGKAGEFEFGYGGSGPHATALAIAVDRGVNSDVSRAELQRLVPEVFEGTGLLDRVVVIAAADVDARAYAAE